MSISLFFSHAPASAELIPPGADLPFRRSSHCNGGQCVEVAVERFAVLVRDTKDPASPVLTYSREEWADFIAGVKGGEFDL
jgi:hypothetical protein